MITHDLGVVAGMADDILVMYAGKPVEIAKAEDLYKYPSHPYTIGLLGAVLAWIARRRPLWCPLRVLRRICCTRWITARSVSVAPSPKTAVSAARTMPVSPSSLRSRALVKGTIPPALFRRISSVRRPKNSIPFLKLPVSKFESTPREDRAPVLEVRNVKKHFPLMKGSLMKRRVGTVKAVDGVSFDIREGECFSIVGESGCGKTTTLLEIMEFSKKTDGEILINGVSTQDHKSVSEILELRKNQQMVFQDPTGALDPRFTVYEILAEPLENQGMKRPDY